MVLDRDPSPPAVQHPLHPSQASQMDWSAHQTDFQGFSNHGMNGVQAGSNVNLVDVLARIATALERGGDDGGLASGAGAAAAVAAAASAVAEAQRPFAASSPMSSMPPASSSMSSPAGAGSPAPVPGTLGAMRTTMAVADGPPMHARERALQRERDRGLERSPSTGFLEAQGQEPSKSSKHGFTTSSSGGSLQAMHDARLPQIVADLEARMSRAERGLSSAGAGISHHSAANEQRLLAQVEALSGRCERLEYEVADLRSQVARRLDSIARDAAASRHEAEEARNEASTLRSEVAELMAQLLQAPIAGAGASLHGHALRLAERGSAMISSRSDATTSTSSQLLASAPVSGPPTGRQESIPEAPESEVSAATGRMTASCDSLDEEAQRDGQMNGTHEAPHAPSSSVKFSPIPKPLMAAESSSGAPNGAEREQAPRPTLPSRAPAHATLPRSAAPSSSVNFVGAPAVRN